jgi:hypothetical protein
MPLYHPRNLYRGVNAHFQSYCQAENDWKSFHGAFIIHLAGVISAALPPGYVVKPEEGLQIEELDLLSGETWLIRRESDLSIYPTTRPDSDRYPPTQLNPAPLLLPAIETFALDPDAYLRSLNIYRLLPQPNFKQPLVHLELLSASNKPGGSAYESYRDKRLELMSVGIHLVEIDFLHESDSPIRGIPSYRKGEPGSQAYYLALSPAQNRLAEVMSHIYSFGVDENIPSVLIPLQGQENFLLDCQAAYDQTFASINIFSHLVDYAAPPAHFDRYHPSDQAKIRALMQRVSEQEA